MGKSDQIHGRGDARKRGASWRSRVKGVRIVYAALGRENSLTAGCLIFNAVQMPECMSFFILVSRFSLLGGTAQGVANNGVDG